MKEMRNITVFYGKKIFLREKSRFQDSVEVALAGVAVLDGASSHSQRVAASVPGQGTYLGCMFDPGPGCMHPHLGVDSLSGQVQEATCWCFSLASVFVSLPSSITALKKKA